MATAYYQKVLAEWEYLAHESKSRMYITGEDISTVYARRHHCCIRQMATGQLGNEATYPVESGQLFNTCSVDRHAAPLLYALSRYQFWAWLPASNSTTVSEAFA
jgi:hypothetical protein